MARPWKLTAESLRHSRSKCGPVKNPKKIVKINKYCKRSIGKNDPSLLIRWERGKEIKTSLSSTLIRSIILCLRTKRMTGLIRERITQKKRKQKKKNPQRIFSLNWYTKNSRKTQIWRNGSSHFAFPETPRKHKIQQKFPEVKGKIDVTHRLKRKDNPTLAPQFTCWCDPLEL